MSKNKHIPTIGHVASDFICYFDESPTIGYCKECETFAGYHAVKGLSCEWCGETDLSLFEWNEDTPFPE
ncbi:hypothetical protein LCGC14_2681540 [marine sediment metagenome]|uniref:Uncharacterized protein n=1 Tax=marine sediment metagenome TaxID=412755 RepID=A0A0F9CCY0_9ZZZZ